MEAKREYADILINEYDIFKTERAIFLKENEGYIIMKASIRLIPTAQE